ncbi:mannitol dehydrogenase family protein [Kocuria tytonis]|uniref:Mannitol-1-phosphate 5-dehydrogenase n=1 Tax=Kocuria tytonis TaxID=2054280 RepID=A0A495A3U8_9MICC|nr:mannitol dehydrogenase family protein [Kocuria tytonis]RKQ34131.1 mannitol dehydrogenase family protein [Kocuria tytonis]
MQQDTSATGAVRLTRAALQDLDIPVPEYDRSAVSVGIVHFGVGGFHRAHQAMYLDRLMNRGKNLDWGICGMGVLPGDAAMKQVMAEQDHLYTLVLKHPDGTLEPRVVGSVVDYVFAPEQPEQAMARLTDPATRIVSLTITEGGYNFSKSTGLFDHTNPAVARDLEQARAAAEGREAEPPGTVFGMVVEALARRREAGTPPFTVMSCDNIQGNGHMAHQQFTAYARLRDPELAEWIEANVPFPNSMVDRITPVTTDADRQLVTERFGVVDRWPVVAEPFAQWALEDAFADGRPAVEEVGVQVVPDVAPYELMKLRLLNASHQALCYPGFLAGYEYAHEVCQDPAFVAYLLGYMNREATHTLRAVEGVDLDAYKHQLIERFANPHVRDTLARLCAESSDRIPTWLVPVIRENLAQGRPVELSATIVASWARYAQGVDEKGAPITVVDQRRERVMAAAAQQDEDELAFIRDEDLFGDLAQHEGFTRPYAAALRSFRERGARVTIEDAVARFAQ